MPPMGKPVYCARHRTEGMAEVRARTCSVPGCGKAPSYGVDGKREVCRDHRTKGMTYAILTCESPNCNKNPSFAPRGETRRRFCKRHAAPHMVNVYYKYCDVAQCPERASFESGGKLRCLQHIEPGMRPRNNICQVPGGGCTRQSSYGPEGGKPVVCTVHKQPGMVQVRERKALLMDIPFFFYTHFLQYLCRVRSVLMVLIVCRAYCTWCHLPPMFNFFCCVASWNLTSRLPSFPVERSKCSAFQVSRLLPVSKMRGEFHRTRSNFCSLADWVLAIRPLRPLLFPLLVSTQVRTKTCKHPGCEKIPSYGFPCMSREYCKPHALEGMVYSAGSRCRFRGCRSEGTFNFPGIRGGSFCKKHREVGRVKSVGCRVGCGRGRRLKLSASSG